MHMQVTAIVDELDEEFEGLKEALTDCSVWRAFKILAVGIFCYLMVTKLINLSAHPPSFMLLSSLQLKRPNPKPRVKVIPINISRRQFDKPAKVSGKIRNSLTEFFGKTEYRYMSELARVFKTPILRPLLGLEPSIRATFVVLSLVFSSFIYSSVIWIVNGSDTDLYVKVSFAVSAPFVFIIVLCCCFYFTRLCYGNALNISVLMSLANFTHLI